MPIGNLTDFKIYQDEFYSGFIEEMDQSVAVLNEGAGGAIRLLTANTRGQYENQSHFQKIDSLISDRDPSSNAELPVQKVTQGEVKDVLKNYTVGPVSNTLDSFRKMSEDPSIMSFIIGQQAGKALSIKLLNSGLGGLVAALNTETDAVFDNSVSANATRTGKATMNHRALIRAKQLMGDRSAALRALVMNSTVAAELEDNQLVEKLGEVSGTIVYGGSVGTLGLPAWVTDSPALTFEEEVSAGVFETRHNVLLLTEEALIIQQQDYMDVLTEVRGGYANLQAFYQAESGYMVRVKGFTWTGPNAPTDGVFADQVNWTYAYSSLKDGPGVLLIVADE